MSAPTSPQPVSDPLDDPANYLNRELGALAFQRRVFEEVQDERNPLLERVKFIAIIGSNLDEFFMVRVGGLCSPAGHRPEGVFLPEVPEGLAICYYMRGRL